ncbi:MAG: hypothetical protein Q8P11_01895 [bacterium]|nr:hypothetical protein [bacterium]
MNQLIKTQIITNSNEVTLRELQENQKNGIPVYKKVQIGNLSIADILAGQMGFNIACCNTNTTDDATEEPRYRITQRSSVLIIKKGEHVLIPYADPLNKEAKRPAYFHYRMEKAALGNAISLETGSYVQHWDITTKFLKATSGLKIIDRHAIDGVVIKERDYVTDPQDILQMYNEYTKSFLDPDTRPPVEFSLFSNPAQFALHLAIAYNTKNKPDTIIELFNQSMRRYAFSKEFVAEFEEIMGILQVEKIVSEDLKVIVVPSEVYRFACAQTDKEKLDKLVNKLETLGNQYDTINDDGTPINQKIEISRSITTLEDEVRELQSILPPAPRDGTRRERKTFLTQYDLPLEHIVKLYIPKTIMEKANKDVEKLCRVLDSLQRSRTTQPLTLVEL